MPLLAAGAVAGYLVTRGPEVSTPDLTMVDEGSIRASLQEAAAPVDRTPTSQALSSVDTDPDVLFVDPGGGSDEADGQTQATAWRSLQASLDRLAPGQTLQLLTGRYDETTEPGNAHYVIESSGTPEAWVRVTAAPGHQPLIVASKGNGISVRASYVQVDGLRFVGEGFGPDNPYGWGVLVRDSNHVRVQGNVISQFPVGGVATVESSNIEILSNELFENSYWGTEQGSGISMWHSKDRGQPPSEDGYHDVVAGNLIYRNENKVFSRFITDRDVFTDGNGIIIDQADETGYTGRILIANNVVFDNGGRGIIVHESSRVDVVHNTTYHNGRTEGLLGGRTELAVARATDVQFLNNLAWSLPGAESMRVTDARELVMGGNVFVTDVHTGPDTELDLVIDGDPGLVGAGIDRDTIDFRPLTASFLAGRAVPTSPHIPFDADLRPRPAVGATVGAYQLAE